MLEMTSRAGHCQIEEDWSKDGALRYTPVRKLGTGPPVNFYGTALEQLIYPVESISSEAVVGFSPAGLGISQPQG